MSDHPTFDFNRIADLYERLAEPLTAPFGEEALDLLSVGPGQTVLDVASGPGALAESAAARGAIVTATDVSPAMTARTAERLKAFPGCEARTASCDALDVSDAAFDASFSMFGVMMIPQLREGLAELVRATRPGGRIAVSAWADPEGPKTMALLKRAFTRILPDRPFWPQEPRNWTAATAKQAVTAAGCRHVELHLSEGKVVSPSARQFVEESDPIFRVVPGYAALDDAERADVLAGLRDELDAFVQTDGSLHLPMPAFIVVGERP